MNPTKLFDLGRVGLLIKKEIFYQRRTPWIFIGGVFVILAFINFLMAAEDAGPNDIPGNQLAFYIITLLFLGTIYTASAFNELNTKSSAQHYLTIPASNLEKLISKWLITGILYVIAFNIFYVIFCIVSTGLLSLAYEGYFVVFNPFETRFEINGYRPWFFSKLYLALHTVYLAGAVYFRKYAYFKTMIAQSFIFFTLLGLVMGVISLIFMDFWDSGINLAFIQFDDWFTDLFDNVFPIVGKLLLWVIFPLWMLTYSYYKLKETEV